MSNVIEKINGYHREIPVANSNLVIDSTSEKKQEFKTKLTKEEIRKIAEDE